MNDRLLKESDVLSIAFQLPLVENSVFYDAVKALPSADRPQEVIAQVTFDEEKLREIVKEAVERFKEEYEVTDRTQGEWIDDGSGYRHKCSRCGENALTYQCQEMNGHTWEDEYLTKRCPNCGADMKGADDHQI